MMFWEREVPRYGHRARVSRSVPTTQQLVFPLLLRKSRVLPVRDAWTVASPDRGNSDWFSSWSPGPRLFLSCPIDVDGSRVWFTDLWNYSIIPYLLEAVREGLQVRSTLPAGLLKIGSVLVTE